MERTDYLSPVSREGWWLAWGGQVHMLTLYERIRLWLGTPVDVIADEVWAGRKQLIASVREEMLGETPLEFLQRAATDGRAWAQELRKAALLLGYADMSEDWLEGWFTNAIETGRQAGYDCGYGEGRQAGYDKGCKETQDRHAHREGAVRKYLEAQASLAAVGIVQELAEKIGSSEGYIGGVLNAMLQSAFNPTARPQG